MLLQVLKSKIHRATVTEANVDYEGSITIDEELMEACGLLPYERVHVWDVTSGNRLSTYVIPPAPRGSGTICINGSAALKIKEGHIVIITSYVHLTSEEYKAHQPIKVIADENNKIKSVTQCSSKADY